MIIKSILNWEGKDFEIEYHDADNFSGLPFEKITQAYGICFCEDKLLIGRRAKNGKWGHLGGKVEKGESPEQTLSRELVEESNSELLSFAPIGYQLVKNPDGVLNYQLRYCCKVRPIGPFVRDPDLHSKGGIDAIKLISANDYREYVDWGEIGDRLMARAVDILKTLE